MDRSIRKGEVYSFNGFQLDGTKRLLCGPDGESLRLMPKAFEILYFLVAHSGRTVDKEELMSAVWPDTIVEENNLTQNISALRRTLGEKLGENKFIATIPGRGYEFVAHVETVGAVDDEAGGKVEADAYGRSNPRGHEVPAAHKSRVWVLAIALAAFAAISVTIALLYRASTATPERRIASVAILPFKPMNLQFRDESLELGMADALITKLNGGTLKVRPLTAVRRFASPDQDPVEAGRQLGVDAVVDGGVQISESRVRVTVKLIRVSDAQQIWSGQFDDQVTDIFAVQDSISLKVADALKAPLRRQNRRDYTQNVEAYRLYLNGRLHSAKLILPEMQQAISYYNQAIAADPSFTLAYVELSNAYRSMVLTNDVFPSEMMPKARAAAEKAVALDPDLADAWSVLAFCDFWYDWDWPAAEEHFKRALEFDPNSARTHAFYAHYLSNTGRHAEAVQEINRARHIDPLDLLINTIEGQILTFAGDDDGAIKILRSALSVDPNFWLAHLFLSRDYIKKGMWDEAIAAAAKAGEITNGNAEAIAVEGYALARAGRRSEAKERLSALEMRSRSGFVPSYVMAEIALALGDKTRAMDLLERAFEQREPLMVFIYVEPRWDEVRNEPRFTGLLRRMNFGQNQDGSNPEA